MPLIVAPCPPGVAYPSNSDIAHPPSPPRAVMRTRKGPPEEGAVQVAVVAPEMFTTVCAGSFVHTNRLITKQHNKPIAGCFSRICVFIYFIYGLEICVGNRHPDNGF